MKLQRDFSAATRLAPRVKKTRSGVCGGCFYALSTGSWSQSSMLTVTSLLALGVSNAAVQEVKTKRLTLPARLADLSMSLTPATVEVSEAVWRS